MKILNTNTHLDPITGGGTAERTFQMSRYLVKNGHKCTILTTNCGMTAQRKKELVGIELIDMPCIIKRIFLPLVPIRKIRNIMSNVDVIHLMGHWSIINIIAYIFARIMAKPYVVCPAGALIIYGRSMFAKKIFNAIIGKRIIRNAAGCIAISKDEVGYFAALGVEKSKITVIPNGISFENYRDANVNDFRSQYGIGQDPYILYLGRLNYYKGPDLLLQAFEKVSDRLGNCKLVFAGTDEGMLEWMKRYVVEKKLGAKVFFVGHIGDSKKSQAYHGSKIVVIPSRQDAMSIVVLEAGATSTPVVLTNKCGFDEVENVEGGIVVEASVEGIADGLLECFNDEEKNQRMGANLYNMTKNYFSWDCIIDQITSFYNDILKQCSFQSLQ